MTATLINVYIIYNIYNIIFITLIYIYIYIYTYIYSEIVNPQKYLHLCYTGTCIKFGVESIIKIYHLKLVIMYKYHSVKIYYKPNLLEEAFLIEKFKEKAPRTYVIKDLNNEQINVTFYEQESFEL